jgi:hypothetical protein
MELIVAVVGAGPIGYFTKTRKQAIAMYLVLWAIVFPIQTVVVHSENPDDQALYFALNALILCPGLGLNRFGSFLRRRDAELAGVSFRATSPESALRRTARRCTRRARLAGPVRRLAAGRVVREEDR